MKLIQGNRRELERRVIRVHMRNATKEELDEARAKLLPKGKLKAINVPESQIPKKNSFDT